MENEVNKEDAELLSYFYNDGELIADILSNDEEKDAYNDAKEAFIDFLNELKKEDYREVIYYAQTEIIPLVKTKEAARFFIDMLSQAFKDIITIQNGGYPILDSYATILQELAAKLTNSQDILIELLKDRNLINTNVNIPLLIDHLVLNIVKE